MSDKGIILRVFGSIFFVVFMYVLVIFSIDSPFEFESSWLSWLLALAATGAFTLFIFRDTDEDGGFELKGTFPVRRFFARSMDGFLVLAIIVGVSVLVKPSLWDFWLDYLNGSGYISYLRTVAFTVLIGYACIIIEIPILNAFGTTPGKWLFGIYLTDTYGGKPTYEQVKGRSFSLFARGMAFCIDIAYYVAVVISYFRLKKHGITRWDEDYGVMVHQKAWSAARAFACIYSVLAVFGLLVVFALQEHI